MTVSSENRVAGPFAGNGSTVDFAFAFQVVVATDVKVVLTSSLNAETTQTLTTHYSVVLNADQKANPGGTVTMVTAHATGEKLTLTSDIPETQGAAIPSAGSFSSTIVENMVDRLTLLHQEVLNLAERALHYPISGSGAPATLPALDDLKGKYLSFDITTGLPIAGTTPAGVTVSAYMQTVLDDLTSEAARRTLDVDHEVLIPVRNVSGSTIAAGVPVYATGYNSGQDRVTVDLADADDAAKMHAIGIMHDSLANNTNGFAIALGVCENVDTSSFSVADCLYVDTTAGGLTVTRPTAPAEVQKIACVLRSHATLGRLLVQGAGRANDVPNGFADTIPVVKGSADATKLVRIEADALTTGVTRVINMPDGDVTLATPTELTKLAGIEAAADVTDATNVDAAGAVMNTGAETVAGVKTFSSDPLIPDEAYAAGWNGKLEPPTKNAVYDKIETLGAGSVGFQATPASQQDNIAIDTDVTVVLGTEIFDVGGDFASNTFTAPVTGKYQLQAFLHIANLDATATQYRIRILTSNRSYYGWLDPSVLATDAAAWSMQVSVLADMDAADTATVEIRQNGGAAQTDITANTVFSGFLAG